MFPLTFVSFRFSDAFTKRSRSNTGSVSEGKSLFKISLQKSSNFQSAYDEIKTVKTNDKIRRFGVVMTPLSRKI